MMSLPDASVKGFTDGTYRGELTACFFSVNNRPAAELYMNAAAPNESGEIEEWVISAGEAAAYNAEKRNSADHIEANLTDVTVENKTTGCRWTRCRAFFDAAAVLLPGGVRGFNLSLWVYSDPFEKELVFYWVGGFFEDVTVYREISCCQQPH